MDPGPKPITKKQGKKTQGPKIELDMSPPPVKETVATPRQQMQQAADSMRQQANALGKKLEQAVRKQQDALRDAELTKQGKTDLVAQRKAREEAEMKAKVAKEDKRRRAQMTSEAKKAAYQSEGKARAAASYSSQYRLPKEVVSKGRGLFNVSKSRGFRRTGFIPQMVMLTALNDKKRSQTVNNATRSPSKAPTGPIKDQITEDIRQHKPSIRQYSEGYRQTMMELQKLNEMAKKELEAALKGRGGFAGQAQLLGPERTKFWVAKGYSLLKQVNEIVSNEAMRWENGSLNAGVAVSTDTRSQSTRKMTKNEFNMHLSKKLNPIVGKAMNEFEEEITRARRSKGAQLGHAYNKVALGNSLPVNKQRSLASADKLRGHGRPVLSEQQGTKGLAGLFPALRSSMQGALHR